MKREAFLPVSRADMQARGISQLDFIYITGDAYVDHPSFGAAIITRVVQSCGFSVGVIAQPDWRSLEDFTRLGRPKYAFLVSSGNIDSMVAHYTAAKKKRSTDYYSPGSKAGRRPDRAVIVYCNCIRRAFGRVPVVIGGLEASLRRFAHYDYWDDAVRRSMLVDSGADLLSYGMGELQTKELVTRLAAGEPVGRIKDIRGTCYLEKDEAALPLGYLHCDDYDTVKTDMAAYARSCRVQYDEQDPVTGKGLIQRHWDTFVVQNPPMRPLQAEELDAVFSLPFARAYHPDYEQEGGVPAIQEVQFSIMHNRGCFGGCNFCSIAFHQGRMVTARSRESVLREAKMITKMPGFKGYIHDVGGPTANFRFPSCEKQKQHGLCTGKKCLAPLPCKNLEVDHREYLSLLRQLRQVEGIKRVFIRSGIRFDYLLLDRDEAFFKELVAHHVSGQLKVAPEHCSAAVLDRMGKPHIERYIAFMERFHRLTEQAGKEQYIVPYLMSSHPGSTIGDAIALARFLKQNKIRPEQVQDFYPTPGTISTCMFYTGLDPYTMKKVYVPKTPQQKRDQRVLLQYYKPENHREVVDILTRAGRQDLIGTGPKQLVAPLSGTAAPPRGQNKKRPGKGKSARGKRVDGRGTKKR